MAIIWPVNPVQAEAYKQRTALPFTPVAITFSQVEYSVPLPPVSERRMATVCELSSPVVRVCVHCGSAPPSCAGCPTQQGAHCIHQCQPILEFHAQDADRSRADVPSEGPHSGNLRLLKVGCGRLDGVQFPAGDEWEEP